MSTIHTQPPTFAPSSHPADRAAGPAAKGQWNGREITLSQKDLNATLANAVEEMAQSAAMRLRERSKSDKKNEISELPDIELYAKENADGYLDLTGQQGQANELMRRMRRTPEKAFTLAQEPRDDPALGFLALKRAYTAAVEDGESAQILAQFEEALAEFDAQHGPAIRASLNTIGVASENAPNKEQLKAFQSTYRDVVLDTQSVAETLKTVLKDFGEARFSEGLQQMIRALGQDLNAARPSTSPVRLTQLVQDLYHLQVVGTILENCGDLCAELITRNQPSKLSSQQLMERLIGLAGERWMNGQRILDLTSACEIYVLGTQIFFMTSIRRLLKRLPTKIFFDDDCRNSVLNASQEALDTLIAREDEGEELEDEENGDEEDDSTQSGNGHASSARSVGPQKGH